MAKCRSKFRIVPSNSRDIYLTVTEELVGLTLLKLNKFQSENVRVNFKQQMSQTNSSITKIVDVICIPQALLHSTIVHLIFQFG